jgi:hypothetical protein
MARAGVDEPEKDSSCRGRQHLRLIGIDVDPAWEAIANRHYRQLYHGLGGEGDDDEGGRGPAGRVRVGASFVTADCTRWTGWTQATTPADADRMLVLCHATVFSDHLLAALSATCSRCKPGTLFVLVSRPLVHPEIETIREGQLEMSWGTATAYLQRRR